MSPENTSRHDENARIVFDVSEKRIACVYDEGTSGPCERCLKDLGELKATEECILLSTEERRTKRAKVAEDQMAATTLLDFREAQAEISSTSSNYGGRKKCVVKVVHPQRRIAVKSPIVSFDVLLSKLKTEIEKIPSQRRKRQKKKCRECFNMRVSSTKCDSHFGNPCSRCKNLNIICVFDHCSEISLDSLGGDMTETKKSLLSKISTYSYQDETALLYQLGPELLLWAASCGHVNIIKLLVDVGIDINSKDKQGRTSLHLAVERYHPHVVRLLLLTNIFIDARANAVGPASIEMSHHGDMTALHLAAANGHGDILNALLEGGADVNAADKWGWTALHWAAWSGHADVVALLLERSPDLVAAKDRWQDTALHRAAGEGHEDVVALLLEKMDRADVAAKDDVGRTALHRAAARGHRDVVALLLGHMDRADVVAKDNLGWTALHNAAISGHSDVVALLLPKMDRADVAAKDRWQSTALHGAAVNGHRDVVALLLGCMDPHDVAAKDSDKRTALHWAARNGHKDVVALLEKWDRDHQGH